VKTSEALFIRFVHTEDPLSDLFHVVCMKHHVMQPTTMLVGCWTSLSLSLTSMSMTLMWFHQVLCLITNLSHTI